MKFFRVLLIFIVCLISTYETFSQAYKDNQVIEIAGKKYMMHKVKMGETIYSLCKTYEVENKDLLNNNPGLITGLKVGEFIKIPYSGKQNFQQEQPLQPSDPTSFIQHKIKRRETPYFIAKKYGITIDDIYKYNPGLRKFKRNETIRIPQWKKVVVTPTVKKDVVDDTKPQVAGSDEMIFHRVKPGETAYSISKLYGCTISEIYFYNPDARNMRIGMEIRIPKNIQKPTEPVEYETEGEYFSHMIETGETLYGLLRKYNVSEDEVKELNPVLRSGFPAGVKLKIPVKYMPQPVVVPVNADAFIQHKVVKGETLTRLSVNYGLKITEIKKYNPALANRDGLILGEVILIPRKPDEQVVTFVGAQEEDLPKLKEEYYEIQYIEELPEGCEPAKHGDFFFKTYHVGLMLPLFLEANDTLNNKRVQEEILDRQLVEIEFEDEAAFDTIVEQEEVKKDLIKKFYGNTENFLHFYEGVLLAIDSMNQLGMDIRLHVYDTKRDIHTVDSLVHTSGFLNLDLVVGPIYPSVQKPVADFAHKNRIPMVSPLSPNGSITPRNPYYFQVNPTYGHLLNKTASLIGDDYFDSNFIVLKMSSNIAGAENNFVELCHEKLFNSGYYNDAGDVSFQLYDFKALGSFGLPRILQEGKQNVFIIPSSREGEISEGVSNINNHASDFDIAVVGTSRFEQYKSISQEHYHNVNLRFIDPYWIDFDSDVTIRFYSKFRETYQAEPNQYSVQGFDVSMFFLKALWDYGRNFVGCLPYMDVNLVQGNYNFEKVSRLGGYMNTGASVISYNPDYTISRLRKIGKINYQVRK